MTAVLTTRANQRVDHLGSRSDRRFAFFGNLMLAILVIGYPLSAVVSQMMGAQSGMINIGFRAAILALSFALGIWTISRGQYRLDALIVIFLTVYTFRLVVDLNYSGLPNIQDDFLFFAATVLGPVLALGGGHVWYNERMLAKLVGSIGGFAGVLIVYSLTFQPDQMLSEAQGGRAGFEFLNPISISYHGLFIAAAALILIFTTRGWRDKLIWVAVVIMGAYLLIAGGSRGPLVALVIAAGLTGLANSRAASSYVALLVVLVPLLLVLGAPQLIVERFLSAGNDASSLERFQSVRLALELALDNPLLGYAYIEPNTGSYPHNLLVESAMALGVFGLVLMLALQVALLRAAWRLSKGGEWLLAFLAMTAFANAWISGSIWGSSLFFAVLWVANGRLKASSGQSKGEKQSKTSSRPIRHLIEKT